MPNGPKRGRLQADMTDVITSNTSDIVRGLDTSYMDYSYWDSSAPSMFKDYMQYFNDIWSPNVPSFQTPNLPSPPIGMNPDHFPY